MSTGQSVRAFVKARLAAVAEEIAELFEKTIAEYEERLCRSNEENHEKQRLLDQILSPRVVLGRGMVPEPPTSPGPGLNQEITATQGIKEEQSVKLEEELLPVFVPESSAVKREEPSSLQQRETEPQGEDIDSETHFYLETEEQTDHSSDTENSDHWEPPFSCSDEQMEIETDGNQHNQVQVRNGNTKVSLPIQSGPETIVSVNTGVASGSNRRAGRKQHQCAFCQKTFKVKQRLERHIRTHTGEKPYSCSTCKKSFAQKYYLDIHRRTHTGERAHSCPVCYKAFAAKYSVAVHMRTHTGERPYSCSTCNKSFAEKGSLDKHSKTHTGEKPYSCPVCAKSFTRLYTLHVHRKTHGRETLQLFNL